MTVSRRDLIKAGLGAGTALTIPSALRAQTRPNPAQTVRMVMYASLDIFDPVYSSTYITADHALAIYDTLFAPDSKFMPQPQMVGKWGVSEDKKIYTFELRDGLGWHDGTPVTAADCVASIRRWAQVASSGRLIMERASDISKKDDKTFIIALKEPLPLLIDMLARIATPCLSIMREKDASRPATEQVTANIGSGPFRFNEALAKPGASFTYDRNEKYVPRREPPDGLAGGKIVKVERVIWENITDPQTAFAALQSREVDFIESTPMDLLSEIKSDPNLELQVLNKGGHDFYLRVNFLQPPFDNVKARQALLHLIDQEAFLRVLSPDPKYGHTLTSIFGNESPYSNNENTGWYKKGGDPEKAKQLFKEAGYAGEKVLILQATNIPVFSDGSQFLAAELRKIGVNAELAPMNTGELSKRRANKDPIENGGWNIFFSTNSSYADGDPMSNVAMVASGDNAWYGWPKDDKYEALRAKWTSAGTLEERKALARSMQEVWWDFVGAVPVGQVVYPVLHRKTLTGLIGMPSLIPMWNMQKS